MIGGFAQAFPGAPPGHTDNPPSPMRTIYLVPALLFGVLAIVFGLYLWQVSAGGKDISVVPSPLIDQPAPEFALPPLDGFPGGLATPDLIGDVSLVNVWASWCAPCRVEHPTLMALAERGLKIYGINIKDEPEDATAFLRDLGNPYAKLGADYRGRVSIDWGVYGVPETFIVDATGRIRYRHVGPIHPGDFEDIFIPLLKKISG